MYIDFSIHMYHSLYYVPCVCVCVFMCCVQSCLTVALQAPLSMGFPRQEYWSGLPFPPPGDLPDKSIKPISPAAPTLASGFFTTESYGKPTMYLKYRNLSETGTSVLKLRK